MSAQAATLLTTITAVVSTVAVHLHSALEEARRSALEEAARSAEAVVE